MMGLTIQRRWDLPSLPLWTAVAYAIGIALLAGAVHIVVILLVPYLARDDGWSRLSAHAGEDAFAELPVGVATDDSVAGLDPLFVSGACRLNLADAPAGITLDARDRFWSVALYDPRGIIVFSINDRTAVQGRLDMIVVDPEQNERLQETPTVEVESTIVAQSPSDDVIAIVRLFAPTRPSQDDARAILAKAECLPAPEVFPAAASG
jgi:uncharacterized membrane protein